LERYKKLISFYSSDYYLNGNISIPKMKNKNRKFPVVILSHGFASNRDEFGDYIRIEKMLNDIGVATFRFDYSGCGNSSYQNGKILCATNWIEDLKSAISYISTRSIIDSNRIALLGTSLGGTNVINTAAEDERIRCIISMSPIRNGFDWIRNNWVKNRSKDEFIKFVEELEEDRRRKSIYGYSKTLKITKALSYPIRYNNSLNKIIIEKNKNNFTYYIQYQAIDSIFSIDISYKVKKISPRPLLILAGKLDEAVPWKENSKIIYDNADEIKRLVLINNGDHSLISGESVENVSCEIIEWLKKYL
jgi:uncharacterized protein